jgi:hypothetical protein
VPELQRLKNRIDLFRKELFAERETRDAQGNVDPRAVTYRLDYSREGSWDCGASLESF